MLYYYFRFLLDINPYLKPEKIIMNILIKRSRTLKAVQIKAWPSVAQMCQQQLTRVLVWFIKPQPAREQRCSRRWKQCLMSNCQRITWDWCISWWVQRVKEPWRKCESSWFLVTFGQHLCNILQNYDGECVLLWNNMALVYFAIWNYLNAPANFSICKSDT